MEKIKKKQAVLLADRRAAKIGKKTKKTKKNGKKTKKKQK